MELRLIRNATLVVQIAGRRLLVDPMLNAAGAVGPVAGTPNPRRNPLVELPLSAEDVVAGIDAVLVSHLHNDHFDARARELLPRDVPLACQPPDAGRLGAWGFRDVRPVEATIDLAGLGVARTGGRHGTGSLGAELGPVSGFVLQAPGEPVLYLAGDTVWCDEVDAALEEHAPDVVVVHAAGARFDEGDPVVMDVEDVIATTQAAPDAMVVAVHLEALNHCPMTRAELAAAAADAGVTDRVRIPADGETLRF